MTEMLEALEPINRLIAEAAQFRPIAMKDEDGWTIETITEGVYSLMQIRDEMHRHFFEAFGDIWMEQNART